MASDAACKHDGMVFETLHWKFFVKCELCGKWRLRRKSDLFWSWRPMYGSVDLQDTVTRIIAEIDDGN